MSKNRLAIDDAFILLQISRIKSYILDEINIYNKLLEKVASHKLAMGFLSPKLIESSIEKLGKMAALKNYYLAISGSTICIYTNPVQCLWHFSRVSLLQPFF